MNIEFKHSNIVNKSILKGSPRNTSVLEFAILLIVAFLSFLFILRPKISSVKLHKQTLVSLQSEYENLVDQEKKMENLVMQLEKSKKDLEILDKSLPLHSRPTWTYLLIEDMVNSSGMTINNSSVNRTEDNSVAGDKASFEPFTAKRSLKKHMVNLSISGTFAQFESFLKKIENNGRIMDITIMEISPSGENLLDFRLSFDTYFYGYDG